MNYQNSSSWLAKLNHFKINKQLKKKRSLIYSNRSSKAAFVTGGLNECSNEIQNFRSCNSRQNREVCNPYSVTSLHGGSGCPTLGGFRHSKRRWAQKWLSHQYERNIFATQHPDITKRIHLYRMFWRRGFRAWDIANNLAVLLAERFLHYWLH